MPLEKDFELSTKVNQWKQNLKASGELDNESLQELESHLLDEIDGLSNHNLNVEEKFMIAQHRIGSEKLLTQAYKRNGGINFQKLSWFGQAFIFLCMFMVLFRMTTLITTNIPQVMQTDHAIGAILVYIGLHLPAITIVFLVYKWTQKKTRITEANTIAIVSLVVCCIAYGIQTLTFRSDTLAINRDIGVLLLQGSFFILVFITFLILNIRESKKLRRAA